MTQVVHEPTVTIGLPIYNGGDSLRKALDSLLRQSYPHFVLHASDDGSTDKSYAILKEYSARDPRVRVTRQPKNIGIFQNAHFVVSQARTPYFMIAAQDDEWAPTFIEKTLAGLQSNPQAVACVPRVEFRRGDTFVRYAKGTFPLTADPLTNLRRYVRKIHCNSRYYSLFRTEVIQESYLPEGFCHAFDWLVCALTLRRGHHIELPEVLLVRSPPEPDRYVRSVFRDEPPLYRPFPILRMSRLLKRELSPEQWSAVRRPIIMLNLRKHREYLAYKFPPFGMAWNVFSGGRRAMLHLYRRRPVAMRTGNK